MWLCLHCLMFWLKLADALWRGSSALTVVMVCYTGLYHAHYMLSRRDGAGRCSGSGSSSGGSGSGGRLVAMLRWLLVDRVCLVVQVARNVAVLSVTVFSACNVSIADPQTAMVLANVYAGICAAAEHHDLSTSLAVMWTVMLPRAAIQLALVARRDDLSAVAVIVRALTHAVAGSAIRIAVVRCTASGRGMRPQQWVRAGLRALCPAARAATAKCGWAADPAVRATLEGGGGGPADLTTASTAEAHASAGAGLGGGAPSRAAAASPAALPRSALGRPATSSQGASVPAPLQPPCVLLPAFLLDGTTTATNSALLLAAPALAAEELQREGGRQVCAEVEALSEPCLPLQQVLAIEDVTDDIRLTIDPERALQLGVYATLRRDLRLRGALWRSQVARLPSLPSPATRNEIRRAPSLGPAAAAAQCSLAPALSAEELEREGERQVHAKVKAQSEPGLPPRQVLAVEDATDDIRLTVDPERVLELGVYATLRRDLRLRGALWRSQVARLPSLPSHALATRNKIRRAPSSGPAAAAVQCSLAPALSAEELEREGGRQVHAEVKAQSKPGLPLRQVLAIGDATDDIRLTVDPERVLQLGIYNTLRRDLRLRGALWRSEVARLPSLPSPALATRDKIRRAPSWGPAAAAAPFLMAPALSAEELKFQRERLVHPAEVKAQSEPGLPLRQVLTNEDVADDIRLTVDPERALQLGIYDTLRRDLRVRGALWRSEVARLPSLPSPALTTRDKVRRAPSWGPAAAAAQFFLAPALSAEEFEGEGERQVHAEVMAQSEGLPGPSLPEVFAVEDVIDDIRLTVDPKRALQLGVYDVLHRDLYVRGALWRSEVARLPSLPSPALDTHDNIRRAPSWGPAAAAAPLLMAPALSAEELQCQGELRVHAEVKFQSEPGLPLRQVLAIDDVTDDIRLTVDPERALQLEVYAALRCDLRVRGALWRSQVARLPFLIAHTAKLDGPTPGSDRVRLSRSTAGLAAAPRGGGAPSPGPGLPVGTCASTACVAAALAGPSLCTTTPDGPTTGSDCARLSWPMANAAARVTALTRAAPMFRPVTTRVRMSVKVPDLEPEQLLPGWRDALAAQFKSRLGTTRMCEAYVMRGCTALIADFEIDVATDTAAGYFAPPADARITLPRSDAALLLGQLYERSADGSVPDGGNVAMQLPRGVLARLGLLKGARLLPLPPAITDVAPAVLPCAAPARAHSAAAPPLRVRLTLTLDSPPALGVALLARHAGAILPVQVIGGSGATCGSTAPTSPRSSVVALNLALLHAATGAGAGRPSGTSDSCEYEEEPATSADLPTQVMPSGDCTDAHRVAGMAPVTLVVEVELPACPGMLTLEMHDFNSGALGAPAAVCLVPCTGAARELAQRLSYLGSVAVAAADDGSGASALLSGATGSGHGAHEAGRAEAAEAAGEALAQLRLFVSALGWWLGSDAPETATFGPTWSSHAVEQHAEQLLEGARLLTYALDARLPVSATTVADRLVRVLRVEADSLLHGSHPCLWVVRGSGDGVSAAGGVVAPTAQALAAALRLGADGQPGLPGELLPGECAGMGDGLSPLHRAARSGSALAAAALVQWSHAHGVMPDWGVPGPCGLTPLHMAALLPAECARTLLEDVVLLPSGGAAAWSAARAWLHATSEYGVTPAALAAGAALLSHVAAAAAALLMLPPPPLPGAPPGARLFFQAQLGLAATLPDGTTTAATPGGSSMCNTGGDSPALSAPFVGGAPQLRVHSGGGGVGTLHSASNASQPLLNPTLECTSSEKSSAGVAPGGPSTSWLVFMNLLCVVLVVADGWSPYETAAFCAPYTAALVLRLAVRWLEHRHRRAGWRAPRALTSVLSSNLGFLLHTARLLHFLPLALYPHGACLADEALSRCRLVLRVKRRRFGSVVQTVLVLAEAHPLRLVPLTLLMRLPIQAGVFTAIGSPSPLVESCQDTAMLVVVGAVTRAASAVWSRGCARMQQQQLGKEKEQGSKGGQLKGRRS
ncbi:hypothetical protein FOA52_006311 [Chlamydomonas sp. UWO 241]|nr:hypothetical protein FOA52_006311 [Chlamydomonas sp. UWO 241]